ncbi:hypothetical protein QW131_22305 [Roseibium salinum]|nr:hypothetical protein [Roseibium salinum]
MRSQLCNVVRIVGVVLGLQCAAAQAEIDTGPDRRPELCSAAMGE